MDLKQGSLIRIEGTNYLVCSICTIQDQNFNAHVLYTLRAVAKEGGYRRLTLSELEELKYTIL